MGKPRNGSLFLLRRPSTSRRAPASARTLSPARCGTTSTIRREEYRRCHAPRLVCGPGLHGGDRLLHAGLKQVHTLMHQDTRVVSYLSAEFLMGPHLGNALVNLES